MYKYVFSDEDSEKIDKKVSLTNDLMSKFDDVDKKYSVAEREVTKTTLNLEKMKFTKN